MSFGYQSLYSNGVNSNTQLRRAVDMVYQRGATYEVVLTGSSYFPSMELDVDIYVQDEVQGRMQIVPYDVSQSGGLTYYRFNIRPYDYVQNFLETEHYRYYWLNDWVSTNQTININNPYPNNKKVNYKYGYRFFSGNTLVTEYTGTPSNNLVHFTDIPACVTSTGFTASGFTNTGQYFDMVGGSFQLQEKFILPNFDQEIGSTIGTGLTINTVDINRRLSPMGQFLMDYPSVPEMSETARFLTDAPRIQVIQQNENYVLWYLNGQTGDRQVIEADFAVFEFYDVSNTRIDYFDVELNYSGTTYQSPTGYTDTLRVWSLPCGPVDIDNIYETINWSNVAYYRVQLFYSYPTNVEDPESAPGTTYRALYGPIGPVSEEFFFYVEPNCGPEDTRLAFLNNRGGFDYYTFTQFRQDTKKIERQTFDNRYYSTSLQSPDRDFARTVKTFDTNVNREFVLESDYLSVAYGEWLQQLFYSPQVYEVRPDYISPIDRQDKVYKDLRPIQILSTEVETITKKHRKLNKYRITCKYADSFFVNKGF